ncbi:MAG: ABC transporter permease [Bacteroidales bacterium]|nr:ABC transporter permease [Bacteroidales bacterium]
MAEEKWDIVIKPKDKLFSVDFKELWAYRDLCSLFVKRNIITRYKQTILGPAWFVIQPAMTVIMYMVVFGGIAGIPTDGVPRPLFYLAGTAMWNYFSGCLTSTSNTFVANAGIFGKVYFPRLVMPVSSVISNLLTLAIQFGFFAIIYIVYTIFDPNCTAHLTWYAFMLPLLIAMMAGLALGFGTIFSSLTTKYRDLQVLLSFLVSLWMYATPIVYPLSQTSGKFFMGVPVHTFMCLNPVTPIIETFKYGFLGCGEFVGWRWILYSFVFMCILLGLGILVFNKVQKSFMDTV